MKYLQQFLIIIAFSFAGELLHLLLPLPVPASIYGIVLLFMALEMKIVKVSDVKEVANFLIAIMPIMFLPPAVGVLGAWDLISSSLWKFVAILFISTFVVMGCTGWVTQLIIRYQRSRKENK